MSYNQIFKNKVVLITGGTGFLGRELTKKILEFNPHSIRLFSRDEVKHHKIQELFNKNKKLRNLIGDVRDYSRLLRAMQGVDIVIHAAAQADVASLPAGIRTTRVRRNCTHRFRPECPHCRERLKNRDTIRLLPANGILVRMPKKILIW